MKALRIVAVVGILAISTMSFKNAFVKNVLVTDNFEYILNSTLQADIDNPDNYQIKSGSGDYTCGSSPYVCTIVAEKVNGKPVLQSGTHFSDNSVYQTTFRNAQ